MKASGYENLPRIFKRTLSRERGLDGHRLLGRLNTVIARIEGMSYGVEFYLKIFYITVSDTKTIEKNGFNDKYFVALFTLVNIFLYKIYMAKNNFSTDILN